MKYKRLLALALAAALCIVAAACGTKANAPGTDTPTKTDTPTAAPGGTQTVGDTGDGTVREDGSYVPGQVNRLRLTYNGNVSSALYVTSAAQLFHRLFCKRKAVLIFPELLTSGDHFLAVVLRSFSGSFRSWFLHCCLRLRRVLLFPCHSCFCRWISLCFSWILLLFFTKQAHKSSLLSAHQSRIRS